MFFYSVVHSVKKPRLLKSKSTVTSLIWLLKFHISTQCPVTNQAHIQLLWREFKIQIHGKEVKQECEEP